jgi:putative membrane protein
MLATAPMSLVMWMGHRWLPRGQRDPLRPLQITERALDSVGADDSLTPEEKKSLAVINHYAYGAAMGSLYAALQGSGNKKSVPAGVAFGMAGWGGSYLGLVPWLELYRSAKEEPAGRNLLIVVAHIVWGASLAILTHRLAQAGTRIAGSESWCIHAGEKLCQPLSEKNQAVS